MNTTNIFEYATRNKLRFASVRGELTVEQLWEVPLRSHDELNLNVIAKRANEVVKILSEENFVDDAVSSPGRTQADMRLAIVKHIILAKVEDEKAAERRVANRAKKEQLLNALAEKQAGKLTEMTEAQLKKQIEALDDEP